MKLFFIIALAIALLGGCASSLSTFSKRQTAAIAAFNAGSSFTGDGRTLLLYADGHWERWGSSCTSATLFSRGTYRIDEKQIFLYDRDNQSEILQLLSYKGSEYLVTQRELDFFSEIPSSDRLQSIYKKWK